MTAVSGHPSGSKVIVGHADHTLRVYDAASGEISGAGFLSWSLSNPLLFQTPPTPGLLSTIFAFPFLNFTRQFA